LGADATIGQSNTSTKQRPTLLEPEFTRKFLVSFFCSTLLYLMKV